MFTAYVVDYLICVQTTYHYYIQFLWSPVIVLMVTVYERWIVLTKLNVVFRNNNRVCSNWLILK